MSSRRSRVVCARTENAPFQSACNVRSFDMLQFDVTRRTRRHTAHASGNQMRFPLRTAMEHVQCATADTRFLYASLWLYTRTHIHRLTHSAQRLCGLHIDRERAQVRVGRPRGRGACVRVRTDFGKVLKQTGRRTPHQTHMTHGHTGSLYLSHIINRAHVVAVHENAERRRRYRSPR